MLQHAAGTVIAQMTNHATTMGNAKVIQQHVIHTWIVHLIKVAEMESADATVTMNVQQTKYATIMGNARLTLTGTVLNYLIVVH